MKEKIENILCGIKHKSIDVYDFFVRDIPLFIKNIYKFRKELWRRYDWDSGYTLAMMKRSLELTCEYIDKKGHEVDISRLKKVNKMRRAIYLLDHHINDTFHELAEIELGFKYTFKGIKFEKIEGKDLFKMKDKIPLTKIEKENNKKIRDLSIVIEQKTWDELFSIIKGQDIIEYRELLKTEEDPYNKWFDGSGIKGWWD